MSHLQNVGSQHRFWVLGQHGSFRIFLCIAGQQDRAAPVAQAKDQRVVVPGG
jgi:hypothetical protein